MPDPSTNGSAGQGFFADLFQSRYREVTWSALIFAVIIGVVMNAAITYAGLKIGFTIGGSAIAAVLGFGFLRGVLRKGTILETNIVQTVASAVNTSNSGVIFTVPVLFLIGYRLSVDSADFWLITLACIAGGMLGTAFIIPLRKQMIEVDRLRFPSPTAVATILKSPGAGSAKAVVLVIGLIVGALIFLPTQLATITMLFGMETPIGLADIAGIGAKHGGVVANETIDVGSLLGLPPQVQLIFAIAPFALGAGFLTGRAGLFVIAGGILAFFILNPIAFAMGWMPETITADKAAGYGFTAFNRPLGIGLLLGGALMGILFALPAMKEALKSVVAASRVKGGGDELGIKTLVVAIVASFAFLFLAADIVGNKPVNLNCPITAAPIVAEVEPASYAGYAVGFASARRRDDLERLDRRRARRVSRDAQRQARLARRTRSASQGGAHRPLRSALDLVRWHHHRPVRGHDRLVAHFGHGASNGDSHLAACRFRRRRWRGPDRRRTLRRDHARLRHDG
jgi:putative OPT family oligopeptide transporter